MRKIILLITVTILFFILSLFLGAVHIPAEQVWTVLTGGQAEKASWTFIILDSRLPQAVTAMLCGMSLAVSGLMLQTSFRNPLAGPSILGITNGASLGVAVVMLLSGGVIYEGSQFRLAGFLAVIAGAFIGALLILLIILTLSAVVKNNIMLLIVGIMVSHLAASAISLLNFFAASDNVISYVLWGMGSFSNVSFQQMPWYIGVNVIGLILAILLVKPLNALLLGDDYAGNLGINVQRTRMLLLLSTGLLTAVTTAFCGPIAFIGLAVPHITRMIIGSENHRILLPATIFCGSAIALLCNILCTLPSDSVIPINAVTPLIGAPVILYVIMGRNKKMN